MFFELVPSDAGFGFARVPGPHPRQKNNKEIISYPIVSELVDNMSAGGPSSASILSTSCERADRAAPAITDARRISRQGEASLVVLSDFITNNVQHE